MALTIIGLLIILIGGLVELGIYFHGLGIHRKPLKFGVGSSLKFWALGDRVLIKEDEFRSGYECSGCGGSGRINCDNCSGTQTTTTGKKCGLCAEGKITCTQCKGKGGLIITPDTAQRRPTSGVIMSVGHKCHSLKVGQSVLYSSFAGYVVDLKTATGESIVLRILHETEILTGMEGHLTLTNLKGKSDIAQFHD